MTNSQKAQEFEKRITKFGLDVIRFCKAIPETTITRPIISQLLRSATSVGANYAEANNAASKKDFANKINICRKEAQESKYWLTMCSEITDDLKREILLQENQELILIFNRISTTMRNGK
jgi:four helix bundle protein